MTQPTQNSNPQYNYQMPPQGPGVQGAGGTVPPRGPAPQQGMPPQGQGVQPPMPPRIVIPQPPRQTKNKFLTFFFALLPGAGQMYHGLMRRGISIMFLFCGVIALATVTYMPVIAVLTPIIWFYSFFDAVNRMNMSVEELKMLEDNYLFYDQTPKMPGKIAQNSTFQKIFKERHFIIGWTLIALAVWIFLNLLFRGGYWPGSMWYDLVGEHAYRAIRNILDLIPSLLIPVICIVIGVKLITGERKKKQDPPRYDEYTIPKDQNGENKE